MYTKSSHAQKPLQFVVHKRDALDYKYSFCIEMQGEFKGWGISGEPFCGSQKHCLLVTKNNPLFLRYKKRKVWDKGTCHVYGLKNPARNERLFTHKLERGNVHIVLKGKKLKGTFALVRLERGGENKWLFIRKR